MINTMEKTMEKRARVGCYCNLKKCGQERFIRREYLNKDMKQVIHADLGE